MSYTHTVRNKVLDLGQMLRQSDNPNAATFAANSTELKMIAYISQRLLVMFCLLRSFYCNKNIFLSQSAHIQKKKIKNVQFSAHILALQHTKHVCSPV